MIAQFLLCALGARSRTPYGVTTNGEPVELLTLRNQQGITVGVLTYGGVITEISVPDRKVSFPNVD